MTKLIITGYYTINGEKSKLISHNQTVFSPEELEQLRDQLRQATGHEINFVHIEKPILEKFIWKGIKNH